MNNAPRVNYLLPIVATLAATLLVMGVVGLLAFFAAALSIRQLTTPTDDTPSAVLSSGLCGLVAVVLLVSLLFFFTALLNGVRDLGQPLQQSTGRVVRKYTGMGRTGGFWIVVAPDDADEHTAPPAPPPGTTPAAPAVPSYSQEDAPSVPRSGPIVQAAPPTAAGTFGAGLAGVGPRRPANAPLSPVADLPPAEPLTPPGSRTFRIDKAVYEALREDERITVAYSRYLEHIYYISHPDGDEQLVLRNTSLI